MHTAISARMPGIAIHYVLFIGSSINSYVFCGWYVLVRVVGKCSEAPAKQIRAKHRRHEARCTFSYSGTREGRFSVNLTIYIQ
jgi:hypothetical protein